MLKNGLNCAAIFLVLSGSIANSVLQAETVSDAQQAFVTDRVDQSESASEKLKKVTAELVEAEARLQDVQQQSAIEMPLASSNEQLAAADFSKTTVRWLGTAGKESSPPEKSSDETLVVASPEVVQLSANALRSEADQSPTAFVAPGNSSILRAQANEEIIYSARAIHSEASQEGLFAQGPGRTDSSNYGEGIETTRGQPVSTFQGCDSGCCLQGCDGGAACACGRCRRRRTIVVSTEAVFLGADINGNRVNYLFDDFTIPVTHHFGPAYDNAELDDFYMVPRISLGVQGECWGVVGRYFHMRAGEHDQDIYDPHNAPPIGISDQGFDANSLFEAYYTDLELTRNFCLNGSKNQFTFGARYALIQHDESIVGMSNTYATGAVPQGILSGGARAQRQAHGTGITFGLNGRKPLFCNSCAHWFYNVRSSILWGCTHNNVETWAQAVSLPGQGVPANAGSKDGALVAVNDDLFIGEVQLGIEWDFALRCLPAKSFFRIAGEYQYWDASSGFAASGSFAGYGDPTATSLVNTNAQAPGLLVDLYGLSVATGFTW